MKKIAKNRLSLTTSIISFCFLCMDYSGNSTPNATEKEFKNQIKKSKFKFHTELSKKAKETMHHADALVISCSDFRLRVDELNFLIEKLCLKNQFDEIVLPGASIALGSSKAGLQKVNWKLALIDEILVLKQLHGFKKIIIVDHEACGGYKMFYQELANATADIEENCHSEVMSEAEKLLKSHFPDVQVYCFFLKLDGVVLQLNMDMDN